MDTTLDPALAAYEEMAVVYDAFTAAYDYDRWLDAVERLAEEHGLPGRRVLDLGCGTGKSFVPLLERGYDVAACDISPAMVDEARRKAPGADVFVADMRALPPAGPFDLVTCLDDTLNYALSQGELRATLAGVARVLAPNGLTVFDTNSLLTYRTIFSATFAAEHDGVFFCWRGEADPELAPGERCAATLEAFRSRGECWGRHTCRHEQRHHPRAEVRAACREVGLEIVAELGQSPGVRLEAGPDEARHTKLLYAARRRDQMVITP